MSSVDLSKDDNGRWRVFVDGHLLTKVGAVDVLAPSVDRPTPEVTITLYPDAVRIDTETKGAS
ncbi:hypothetical protein [Stenotrophomonas sp.]|uniref:hypothetical protein n=1 Tax=Stenotrophomonas sp. TaxID=69392 RepID=UPI0028AD3C2C|nr:hypothetical protein [Stenotrophomonas sp.]